MRRLTSGLIASELDKKNITQDKRILRTHSLTLSTHTLTHTLSLSLRTPTQQSHRQHSHTHTYFSIPELNGLVPAAAPDASVDTAEREQLVLVCVEGFVQLEGGCTPHVDCGRIRRRPHKAVACVHQT
jgi:hypothetical protein